MTYLICLKVRELPVVFATGFHRSHTVGPDALWSLPQGGVHDRHPELVSGSF